MSDILLDFHAFGKNIGDIFKKKEDDRQILKYAVWKNEVEF